MLRPLYYPPLDRSRVLSLNASSPFSDGMKTLVWPVKRAGQGGVSPRAGVRGVGERGIIWIEKDRLFSIKPLGILGMFFSHKPLGQEFPTHELRQGVLAKEWGRAVRLDFGLEL